ncbi:MAG: protein phosphatase 2C domain-containing protein [Gemmatimonadota bacterium]
MRPMQVTASGRTDTGQRRGDNQDSMLIADLSASGGFVLGTDGAAAGAGSFSLGVRGAILLVADGMGGAAAGALASRLTVNHIHQAILRHWVAEGAASETFPDHLRAAVEGAGVRVAKAARQDPSCTGMGTTATLAGLLDGVVHFAQVGDSRGYLVRDGVATQLTRDQSVVQQLVDAGTMTPEEAERSIHSNRILQAVGVTEPLQVVVSTHEMHYGDVLLLCSDGLSRVVSAREMAAAFGREVDVTAASDALVALANERGGPDNITVVAARVDAGMQETPGADPDTLEFPSPLL